MNVVFIETPSRLMPIGEPQLVIHLFPPSDEGHGDGIGRNYFIDGDFPRDHRNHTSIPAQPTHVFTDHATGSWVSGHPQVAELLERTAPSPGRICCTTVRRPVEDGRQRELRRVINRGNNP